MTRTTLTRTNEATIGHLSRVLETIIRTPRKQAGLSDKRLDWLAERAMSRIGRLVDHDMGVEDESGKPYDPSSTLDLTIAGGDTREAEFDPGATVRGATR